MEQQTLQPSGPLSIDREAREVTIDGRPVHLTRVEFELLSTLAESPRRAFSREYLTRLLTHSEWADDTHALDTSISRLRRKLGESGNQPRRVVTVHGYGYRFEPDSTTDVNLSTASTSDDPGTCSRPRAAFAIVALDRRIAWASDDWDHVLGWHPADLHGKLLYDLILPDDRHVATAARHDLDAGLTAAMLLRMRTASGDYRAIEALGRPIVGHNNNVGLFLGEYRLATSDMVDHLPALRALGSHPVVHAHLG